MFLLVVVGHGMMCNLSLVLYHLLLSALETLMLHGSTSVRLNIRRSLVYLLVDVWHGMMCSLTLVLSLVSKFFRNSYAPWKHFGAFKY